MNLLEKSLRQKQARAETGRMALLTATEHALRELLPNEKAILFGSLVRPGKFHENSDIDIALFQPPANGTEYGLQALLEETLHRRVDIVLLPHCRFRDKILKEGIPWTS